MGDLVPKFSLEPTGEMRRWAEVSDDGRYRYVLGRRWSDGPLALVCGANPSTADHRIDDATVRKWTGFFRLRPALGGFVAVNLYAFRSRDPRALPADSCVGPDNDLRILRVVAAEEPPLIVACWGDAVRHVPGFAARVGFVASVLLGPRVQCWGRTSSGNPRHPLMLPYSTKLEPFTPATTTEGGRNA